ncbi:MAG TPA: hypothetical protein ENN43_02190 [bacterium]|nr:hypothetical protein [bacterium]
MKKTFILFILAAVLSSVCFARPFLFVSHDRHMKLTVINTANNEVAREIPLDFYPKDIKLTPDEQFLYIAGYDTNALYRLRTRNFTIDSDFISVGSSPVSLAITPDSKKIYVINSRSKNVTIVDLPDFNVSTDPVPLPAAPVNIVITNDGKKAFIALSDSNGIAVMSLVSNKILGVIQTGAGPWGMHIHDHRLFVTNEKLASISVIDTNRNRLVNEIVSTDLPRGICGFGNFLYVAVSKGLDIFETVRYEKPASMSLFYSVYDAEHGRTASGDRIFIAGYDDSSKTGKIAVLDPRENEIIKEIDVDGRPYYLEMRRQWPTPVPTVTNTAVPTPVFTAVPTSTPIIKPTPKPKPRATAKPAPKPTAAPSLLSSDIRGRVFLNNNPVPNVDVKAINRHNNKIYTAKTDGSGRFMFKALPIGGYVVSVEASYLKGKAVALTVNQGTNPDVIINVERR